MANLYKAIMEDCKGLKKSIKRLHSPLKIETVLKAHYLAELRFNEDYDSLYDVVSQLMRDDILILKHIKGSENWYDRGYYVLTEKGKAFVDMILNTPYPVKVWADPRD
jgi:hypothetical protein